MLVLSAGPASTDSLQPLAAGVDDEPPPEPRGPDAPPVINRYDPSVEQWRSQIWQGMPDSLKSRPDAATLLDKTLHAVQGESSGDPGAVGDGGIAHGLFQSHYVGAGATPQAQIADAWRLVQGDIAGGGTGFGDWGEGRSYQGQPFGAFGRTPYGAGDPLAQHLSTGQTSSFIPGPSIAPQPFSPYVPQPDPFQVTGAEQQMQYEQPQQDVTPYQPYVGSALQEHLSTGGPRLLDVTNPSDYQTLQEQVEGATAPPQEGYTYDPNVMQSRANSVLGPSDNPLGTVLGPVQSLYNRANPNIPVVGPAIRNYVRPAIGAIADIGVNGPAGVVSQASQLAGGPALPTGESIIRGGVRRATGLIGSQLATDVQEATGLGPRGVNLPSASSVASAPLTGGALDTALLALPEIDKLLASIGQTRVAARLAESGLGQTDVGQAIAGRYYRPSAEEFLPGRQAFIEGQRAGPGTPKLPEGVPPEAAPGAAPGPTDVGRPARPGMSFQPVGGGAPTPAEEAAQGAGRALPAGRNAPMPAESRPQDITKPVADVPVPPRLTNPSSLSKLTIPQETLDNLALESPPAGTKPGGLNQPDDVAKVVIVHNDPRLEAVAGPRSGGPGQIIGNMVVGGLPTTDQWVQVTEASAPSVEQIMKDSRYYTEVPPAILQAFETAKTPAAQEAVIRAYAYGNRRASSERAAGDVLRVEDRLTGQPRSGQGTMNTEIIKPPLQGRQITGGVGPKLSDFDDILQGKNETRTWAQDDPRAEKPFVVDTHTSRDMGYIDPEVARYVEKQTGKTLAELGLVSDSPGASFNPSEVEYELGSRWGNQLTRELNDMNDGKGWLGKNDWQPHEIQAIGWARVRRELGLADSGATSIVRANSRTVAVSSDSPLVAENGWGQLLAGQRAKAVTSYLRDAIDHLREQMPLARVKDMHIDPTGQVSVDVFASPETVREVGQYLAYVTGEQSISWRPLASGKTWAKPIDVPEMTQAEMKDFTEALRELGPHIAVTNNGSRVWVMGSSLSDPAFETAIQRAAESAKIGHLDFQPWPREKVDLEVGAPNVSNAAQGETGHLARALASASELKPTWARKATEAATRALSGASSTTSTGAAGRGVTPTGAATPATPTTTDMAPGEEAAALQDFLTGLRKDGVATATDKVTGAKRIVTDTPSGYEIANEQGDVFDSVESPRVAFKRATEGRPGGQLRSADEANAGVQDATRALPTQQVRSQFRAAYDALDAATSPVERVRASTAVQRYGNELWLRTNGAEGMAPSTATETGAATPPTPATTVQAGTAAQPTTTNAPTPVTTTTQQPQPPLSGGPGAAGGGAAGGGAAKPPPAAPAPGRVPSPPEVEQANQTLDSARKALLQSVVDEARLRRQGVPQEEIAQGRSRQAQGIHQGVLSGIEAGLSPEEIAAQGAAGARTGQLRKTFAGAPQVSPDQRAALIDEANRQLFTGQIQEFDWLRTVGTKNKPGALTKALEGRGLQPNEIEMLRKVYGDAVAEAVMPQGLTLQEALEASRGQRFEPPSPNPNAPELNLGLQGAQAGALGPQAQGPLGMPATPEGGIPAGSLNTPEARTALLRERAKRPAGFPGTGEASDVTSGLFPGPLLESGAQAGPGLNAVPAAGPTLGQRRLNRGLTEPAGFPGEGSALGPPGGKPPVVGGAQEGFGGNLGPQLEGAKPPKGETPLGRAYRELLSLVNAPISIVTYGHEPIFRQGLGFALSHPSVAKQALADMVTVAKNPEAAALINARLNSDPYVRAAIDAGWLTENDRPAETVVNKVLNKFPGMRNSRESARMYLTSLRKMGYADEAAALFRSGNWTDEDAKALWDTVGDVTGHGLRGKSLTVGGMSPSFSPEAMFGRFRGLSDPFIPEFGNPKAGGSPLGRGARNVALKNLLALGGLALTIEGLAYASGDDLKWDLLNTPLGKVTLGPSTLDPSAGYGTIIRLAAKTADAVQSGDFGRMRDALSSFVNGQLGPVTGTMLAALSGQDWQGKDFNLVKAITENPTKQGSLARQLFVPIAANAIWDAAQASGLKGALFALPSLGAMSVDTNLLQDARDKATRRLSGGKVTSYADAQNQPLLKQQVDKDQSVVEAKGSPTPYQQASDTSHADTKAMVDQQEASFAKGLNAQKLQETYHDATQRNIQSAKDLNDRFGSQFAAIPQSQQQQLLQKYFDLGDPQKNPTATIAAGQTGEGNTDFDKVASDRADFVASLPKDQQDFINQSLQATELNKTPLHQEYDKYIDAKKQAGYFETHIDPVTKRPTGITPQQRQALDIAHPDLDVAAWRFGSVGGKAGSALNSTRAVQMALQTPDAQNKEITFQGLSRAINQSSGSLQMWKDSQDVMNWYLNELPNGKDAQNEAQRLARTTGDKEYQKSLADMDPKYRTRITDNLHTAARKDPEVDAYLYEWGGAETLNSQAAADKANGFYSKYNLEALKAPKKAA